MHEPAAPFTSSARNSCRVLPPHKRAWGQSLSANQLGTNRPGTLAMEWPSRHHEGVSRVSAYHGTVKGSGEKKQISFSGPDRQDCHNIWYSFSPFPLPLFLSPSLPLDPAPSAAVHKTIHASQCRMI